MKEKKAYAWKHVLWNPSGKEGRKVEEKEGMITEYEKKEFT